MKKPVNQTVPNELVDKYLPLFKGEQLTAVLDMVQQTYKAGLDVGRSESSLFVVIPIEILQSQDLSQLAKILYGGIIALSRQTGFCYATNKYLGRTIGVAEQSVNRPLRELAAKGKIRIEVERDKSGTHRYIYPVFTWGGSSKKNEGGCQRTRGGLAKEQGQKINRQSINKQSKNTVEAEASVIDKNVDNSGDKPKELALKEPYNRTPNGNCNGCTDPDPLGGTHCEGTYQHPLPEKKNTVSSIGDVLKKHQSHFDTQSPSTKITHEFQVEALRYWEELGLKGTPSRNFFRHIQLACKNGKQGRLQTALSYCKDAENIRDREKLFYWRFANEPGKAGAQGKHAQL
ncbi:MAG: hypothetical protein PHQ59_01985 [Candidatus Daviesbacteria bacterium]|nr:hypothetical protein [Candidatus Daviesbacteria bacterium]